jgi:hypothetical protein
VVESDGLENRYTGNGIGGSNPSLSASFSPTPRLLHLMEFGHTASVYAESFRLHLRSIGQDDGQAGEQGKLRSRR